MKKNMGLPLVMLLHWSKEEASISTLIIAPQFQRESSK